MVRTSGGIRISAGKSSKKSGGGGSARPASSATPSSSGKSSSKGSHLPPIPHCEVPSWQKPITNFFNVGASTSKEEATNEKHVENHIAEEIDKENDSSNMNKNDLENKDALQDKQNTSDVEPLENN